MTLVEFIERALAAGKTEVEAAELWLGRANTIRFIRFGRMGPSPELIAKVTSDPDHRRCLDGHPATTIIKVATAGSIAVCDEPDCASCVDFRTVVEVSP